METKFVIEGEYIPGKRYTQNIDVVMNDNGVSILSETRYDSFHTMISPEDSIKFAQAILKHYEEKI